MKKLLSLLLALATVIATFSPVHGSANAVAEGSNPEQENAYSEYRFPVYDGEPIPGYTALNYQAEKLGSLFVFCGSDGTINWRIYAERDIFQNGIITNTESGFLPCAVVTAETRKKGEPNCRIVIAENAGFVDISQEDFGTATVKKSKKVQGAVYGTYDGILTYLYPSVDGKTPAPGAIPVTVSKKGKITFTLPGGDKVQLTVQKQPSKKKATNKPKTESPNKKETEPDTIVIVDPVDETPADTGYSRFNPDGTLRQTPTPTSKPTSSPKPETPKPSGHYEEVWIVDRPSKSYTVCNGCGATFSSTSGWCKHAEASGCGSYHVEWTDEEGHYEKRWVED